MFNELDEAQRLLDQQDEKIEEQDQLIKTLGEEVEHKFALQAKLNEQEVRA